MYVFKCTNEKWMLVNINPPDITIKDRVGYILNTYVIKKKNYSSNFSTQWTSTKTTPRARKVSILSKGRLTIHQSKTTMKYKEKGWRKKKKKLGLLLLHDFFSFSRIHPAIKVLLLVWLISSWIETATLFPDILCKNNQNFELKLSCFYYLLCTKSVTIHTNRLKDLVCGVFLVFSESGFARSRA